VTTGWDTWYRRLRDLVLLAAGLVWGNNLITDPAKSDPLEVGIVMVCLGVPVAGWADEAWRRWAERRPPPTTSGPSGTAGTPAAERAEL
jgi:hypothetical protein